MDNNAYDLVVEACKLVADTDPRLQRQQHESAEMSALGIRNEVSGFVGAIHKDREEVHRRALEVMQPLVAIFDLGLLQLSDLSHFAWENRNRKAHVLWPLSNSVASPHPNGVFYLLTSNLAQSFQAIRLLLLHGYESQSRAMVRTFIEAADLTLAVAAYEDVYQDYGTSYENEAQTLTHWHRKLRPGVIRKRLAVLDQERSLSTLTAIPAHEVRAETYHWFSMFSHVNFVAHIVGAHPPSLEGANYGPIAMLGEPGAMTEATFQRVLLYLWLFFAHFDELLWNTHRWSHLRGRRDRRCYRYRSKVFDSLFRKNYSFLQGIT